ncbi:MAG: ribonuclease HII, partial [Pseudomonadota bacterium]|nr:ribonuclease HII [Pseudomonadota bacterium]
MNPELERCAGWPRKKIAGVDEAGRGCWAGPVVAAAVILPASYDWDGLDDSKKLSAEQRARLSAHIRQDALTGLGIATAAEID